MSRRRKSTPEGSVQSRCIGVLESFGLQVHRRNVTRVPFTYKGKTSWVWFNEAGMSDLWCIIPGGVHLEVEIKKPGEMPTQDQLDWLNSVIARGGVAIWTDCDRYLAKAMPLILEGYRVVGFAPKTLEPIFDAA